MKSRQRLLGALLGKPVDRTPWSPFLSYYWQSLPQDVQERGQFTYLKAMGADPLLRGFYTLSDCRYTNCEIKEKSNPQNRYLSRWKR